MKKVYKVLLSILIIFSILLTEYPYIPSVEAAVRPEEIYSNKADQYDNCGLFEFYDESHKSEYDRDKSQMALQSNGQPMPRYIIINGQKYFLNHRIYVQKNLYVYGSYRNVPGNYFRYGYQLHEDLSQLEPKTYYTGGYFGKPSDLSQIRGTVSSTITRGEWKYLGYDIMGNTFSNMWMTNVATKTSFIERNWQLEPWDEPIASKPNVGIERESDYNRSAYGDSKVSPSVRDGARKWIAATVNNMTGYPGIHTKNSAYPSGYSQDVYKFMYIQSPPTLTKSGSGKMWHLPAGSSTYWYQTFSIPHLKTKEHLPVDCEITPIELTNIPEDNSKDNQEVILSFKVTGTLRDDIQEETKTAPEGWVPYYKDPASQTVKYTRKDLLRWNMSLTIKSLGYEGNTALKSTVQHSLSNENRGFTTIQVKTTIAKLKTLPKNAKGEYEVFVSAVADPIYRDNSKDPDKMGRDDDKFPLKKIPIKKKVEIPTVKVKNNVGSMAFDDVPFTDCFDNTDLRAVKYVDVTVNGQAIEYDLFYSGNYQFPKTTNQNGYFAEVITSYNVDKSKIVLEGLTEEERAQILSSVQLQMVTVDYVYVYPTKPIAQFAITSNSWKQNRIINIQNTSASGNIQLVVDRFPITEYRWYYGGDTKHLNKGTDTDFQKQLQYKQPGSYSVTIQCKNTLGKWSDPYTVDFQVLEDYSPNIEVNLSDSILTRTDEQTAWHYDVNSTDGDRVATAKIELWYDSNNDKVVDTKIREWNGLGDNGICEIDDFPKYTPTELGYYKYKIYAKDEFVGVAGQDTLPQFVTDTDKKAEIYEVEFWVDNYQPLSDLYIDVAIERPQVDLFIMGDKNLSQEKLTYFSENRVTIENTLLGRNILPSVNLWNMKTYTYETPASTTLNTGSGYPPASTSYSSSGYSGTLNRYNVSDNGSSYDYGRFETRYETRAVTTRSYGTYGQYDTPPGFIYVDGWLEAVYGYVETTTYQQVPVEYWVPNVQWVSNYTGYYSGTIYKQVRQPYTDPWRANSTKYILYISDDNISEISDFNMVLSKCDAKVILAGKPDIQLQYLNPTLFINTEGKSAQEILDEVLAYIGQETPSIEQVYVLPNQTFTLNVGENDLENDTIIKKEMQYVHDKGYFDNSTGQEPGTRTSFSNAEGWTTTLRSSFSNVGKYQVFRRVQDKPDGAYGEDYSYYSGVTEVDIFVHRRPVALATLDWDFDGGTGLYKTKWIDKSYDSDHSITRADIDKGIRQRKLMFRKIGGDWNYSIPENLSPGTYNLRYYIQDIESTWSEVFTITIDGRLYSNVTEVTFTLAESPPMQFDAKLRSENMKFRYPPTPVTLPASENLELFEIWSRYPSNPFLQIYLSNLSNSQVSPTKFVYYNENTGRKKDNDINWSNITYNTPKTLPDGSYILTVTANAQKSKTITFPVEINTPINLVGYINGRSEGALVNTGDENLFTFTTSKYVSSVQLSFEGQVFYSDQNHIKLVSETESIKTWAYTLNIADGAYPDGKLGNAEFKAYLPSGKNETVQVGYKVVGIRATSFLITMMLDVGWRSYYFNTSTGIDDNHDGKIDRYPKQANTDIRTTMLPVNFYSLIGYSKTFIKAGYKVKGSIDIQGSPDSAYFNAKYQIGGVVHSDRINLSKASGNTYLFEWIIPLKTDSKSFVTFELAVLKGSSTYGNEKWVDVWDVRNTDRRIFYVNGNAMDDLTYVQSN